MFTSRVLHSACSLALLAAPLCAQHWYEGLANYPETTTNAQFVAAGDFDGDGDVDTLVRSGGTLETWFNVGSRGRLELGPVLTVVLGTRVTGFESRVLDLDGDGALDVAAWRGFPQTQQGFVLLRGLGDGSFTEEFLQLDGTLLSMGYGDFDGDGDPDVAALLTGAFPAYGLAWVRWQNGGLQLGGTAAPADVQGFDDLAGVDWDGDGTDDLALSGGGELELWLGTGGDPALLGREPVLIGPGRLELVDADFDANGREDLLAIGSTGSNDEAWRLFAGAGPGALVGGEAGSLGGELSGPARAGDWDLDGDLDLVSNTLIFSGAVTLIENTEDQGFRQRAEIVGGATGVQPGLADLDGDGFLDALVPRGLVFGNGVVERPWPLGGSGSGSFSFADREGDGDPDRFFQGGFVELTDGTGAKTASLGLPPTPAGFGYTGSVGVGDLTGDGRLDFLCGYSTVPPSPFEPADFIEMRLVADDGLGGYNDLGPAGPPDFQILAPLLFGAVRSFLVDLDADGDLDLLWGGDYWPNTGSPSAPFFASRQSLFANPAQAVADLDGDGDQDVVTLRRDNAPQVLRLERNLGGLAFAPEILAAESKFPTGPSLLDLDADGDLDLAISTEQPQSRLLLLENVAGTFAEVAELPTPQAGPADFVGVEDVDADGVGDLVLGRVAFSTVYTNHHLSVLRGSGAPFDYDFAGTWRTEGLIGLTDADGDGDLDALNSAGALRATRFDGAAGGLQRQYGAGGAGSGDAVPVLGATGPWRVGSTTASLRVALGNGGAPAFLAISPAEDLLIDFPLAGLTTLVSPGLINLLQFGLDGAGAGDGELVLPVNLANPAFAGVNRFHQLFVVDAGAAMLLAPTNGLEIRIGQ